MSAVWPIAGIIAGAVVALLLLSALLGLALRWLLQRPLRPDSGSRSGFVDGIYFGYVYLKILLAAHMAGALGGILYYLAISPLLGGPPLSFLVTKGIANGVFFLGWVWGPGIALIGTFIHAHRLWKRMEPSGESGA